MKKFLLATIGLVVVLLIAGYYFLPSSVHLERETVIEAPPHTIFALVNSYARFNEWSPWAEIDPEGTEYEYSGPAQGVGAKMAWRSENNEVGVGSQEITGSTPYSEVLTALDFGDQGTAEAFYRLTPEGSGTRVVWGFDSEMGSKPIAKFFGYFLMEGMLGPQYEQGLASLKALAESLPEDDWTDIQQEIVDAKPMTIAFVSGSTSQDHAEIGEAFAQAYGQVVGFMQTHELQFAGQPLSINKAWGDTYEFDAGIPVASTPESVPEDSPVQIKETYSGKAVKAVHIGAYSALEESYAKVKAYMAVYGLEENGHPWDVWISDPTQTPEDELITHIYFPMK